MTIQSPIVLASGFFSQLFPGDTVPGTDTTAQASGNAALVLAGTALASGNAGLVLAGTALASGNAGLVSASNKVPISGGYMTGQLFAASGVVVSGTLSRNGFNVVTVGDVETVTSTMIASGTIIDADVNISGAINATKLNFLQAGASGVARTVDSKLKDFISVLDFGANPNGAVDCTNAINNAINAAATGYGYSDVCFPAGTYYITSPIILKPNVGLRGLTSENAPNATRYGATITTDQSIYMISQTQNPAGEFQNGLYDLFLDGQNIATRGVYFQYARGSRFERVVVMRCREYGFYMDNPSDYLDSYAWDFNQCYVNMPNGQYPSAPLYAAYHVRGPFAHFFNCKSDGGVIAYQVQGSGVSSSAGYAIFQNCHSEGFKSTGISLEGAAGKSKVLGCTLISSTTDAIGTGQSYIKIAPNNQTGSFLISANTLVHSGTPGANTIGVELTSNAPAAVVANNSIENHYYSIKSAAFFACFSFNQVGAYDTAYYITGASNSVVGGYADCGASGYIVNNQSGQSLKNIGFIETTKPTRYLLARPLNNTSTFRAIGSTVQTLANITWTKVILDGTETWDSFGEFASSTFTAIVPGYYQFNGSVELDASAINTVALYQNGVLRSKTPLMTGYGSSVSAVLKLAVNETVELYVLVVGTPSTSPAGCRLDGYLLSTT